MRLTDEMIQEDDKRFKRQNLLAEFNYCGKEVPKRKSITNDDIRFYAWLCRSAYALLKEQEALEKRNEPVKVRHLHNAKVTMHEEVTFTDECGNCGGYLVKTWKACPLCGRSVKWDD